MKVRCINNQAEGRTINLEIGEIYDVYEMNDITMVVYVAADGPDINGYKYTFSMRQSIPNIDDEGKPYYEITDWYWENFFEKLRNKNLNDLLHYE